jgi:hypothetical protein
MNPLPPAVVHLLRTLPDETRKIILNTNGKGHWEIEVFTRYQVDEPTSAVPLARDAHRAETALLT